MAEILPTSVSEVVDEWLELDKEYLDLQECHKNYRETLEEMTRYQSKCVAGIKHHRYRMRQITSRLQHVKSHVLSGDSEGRDKLKEVEEAMRLRTACFTDMEDILPRPNGYYLMVILGNVNVSILNKADKFKYKEDYEKFKLVCVVITMVLATTNLLTDYRVLDALLYFLLVWYYCTLTIRESILVQNGSRIKGWWVAHHYISTALSGILITWPYSHVYRMFRDQFVVFCLWLSVVNVMQYYYQRGCIYRLRALGERHNMDITVEGFQSWMWRGLTFLLPFLASAYAFQLYNAYTLFTLSSHPECREWQVPVLAMLFFTLFAGNVITMSMVLRRKLHETFSSAYHYFVKHKYKMN